LFLCAYHALFCDLLGFDGIRFDRMRRFVIVGEVVGLAGARWSGIIIVHGASMERDASPS